MLLTCKIVSFIWKMFEQIAFCVTVFNLIETTLHIHMGITSIPRTKITLLSLFLLSLLQHIGELIPHFIWIESYIIIIWKHVIICENL